MFKPPTLEERIQYKSKMVPTNPFGNTAPQIPQVPPYPSVLHQTASKKKISPRKVQRHRDVEDNRSQSQSYSQAGQQNQSHSYVQT